MTAVMMIYIYVFIYFPIGSQNKFLIVLHFYNLENVILKTCKFKLFQLLTIDDDDIVIGTPSKVVKELYSTKDNWKILNHTLTRTMSYKTIVTHSSATDKWTVDKTFETTYNEEPPV